MVALLMSRRLKMPGTVVNGACEMISATASAGRDVWMSVARSSCRLYVDPMMQ